MATDIKLDEAEKLGARKLGPAEYQAIVGSLVYVALATQPDISLQYLHSVATTLSSGDAPDRSQASFTITEDDRKPPLALPCQR